MHAVLALFSAIVAIFLGLTWAGHCGKKAAARMRAKELDELPKMNPAYYRPLRERKDEERRVKAIVDRNETLIGDGRMLSLEVVSQLICHPSIWCRYTTLPPVPNTVHGIRHAVWREDMRNPLCPACMAELGVHGVKQHA